MPLGGSPEMRELAEALDGLAGDLQRQRRSRERLAQDLSHELRTPPLTLVQSRLEAMQDGVVPIDEARMETLRSEVLRLGGLINQIERLAEAEALRPRPRLEVVPLHEPERLFDRLHRGASARRLADGRGPRAGHRA